jgi:trans-aconitate 2-methyltransferase
MSNPWDPDQYQRFAAERSQPFYDLLALVQPAAGGRVVDFGCGTGELTAVLHERVEAKETAGIDTSAAMLEKAPDGAGLTFRTGDLRDTSDVGPVDIVFANASLHWVPDHASVLASWADLLAPGGQLAVQVPANVDHLSHTTSSRLAAESPFLEAFGGEPPPDPVLSVLRPEDYAVLLHRLGFTEQHVRLQVYGHLLGSTADVVEWVKGTSLTRFKEQLPGQMYEEFVDIYRRRLVDALGDQRPFFYPFKRILFWARRPRHSPRGDQA